MWAAATTLRLGTERDLWVGVRSDDRSAIEQLTVDLAERVDPEFATELPASVRASFRVVAGRRQLPFRSPARLEYGSDVIAQSRSTADMVEALRQVVGGVEAVDDHPEYRWQFSRLFICGDRAVAVDVPGPALLSDRRLRRARITELATWGWLVDGGDVVVPPKLGESEWRRFRLVGHTDGDSETTTRQEIIRLLSSPSGSDQAR